MIFFVKLVLKIINRIVNNAWKTIIWTQKVVDVIKKKEQYLPKFQL